MEITEEYKETAPKKKYSVPAVETAFRILQLLSRKKYSESTLSEIAKALTLTPTTCFRILQQLVELSIVRFDEYKKRYTLGPYLVVLGERAKEHLDYISVCIPYLQELTNDTGLTSVLINRIEDAKLTFVAKVEGNDYGLKVSIGRHFSIVDAAYGKCFLAYMEPGNSEYFLRHSKGLKSYSEEELKDLKHEFIDIKSNGYAMTYGEYLAGIFGVAAPIFIDHKMEMSIALIGLTAQFSKEQLSQSLGPLVGRAASSISEKLSRNI